WKWRVAGCISIGIRDANTNTILNFERTKVVQERSPLFVFFDIFSDMLRKQNVTGIAAIHHPLRHIKSGTGKIGLTVHIDDTAHRSAVYSYSKFYIWVFFVSAIDVCRSFSWLLRAFVYQMIHLFTVHNRN